MSDVIAENSQKAGLPPAAAPNPAPVADNKNGAAQAPTPAPADNATKAGFTLPKGLAAELHNLREERRKTREENEALKKALDEAKHPAPAPAADVPSFIDDPDKRLAIESERIKADVLSAVRTESEKAARAQYLQEQGAKAIDLILTQPEVNGDTAKYHEVDALIAGDLELSETARVAPVLAAKEAMERWRKIKGLDGRGAAAEAAAAVAGAKPAPATPSGRRSVAEIKADLTRLNPHALDFNKKWESLLQELSSAAK